MESNGEIGEMRERGEGVGVILEPSPRASAPPPSSTTNRDTQTIYWCLTWNNYSIGEMERLERVLQHECDWFIFQEEIGDQGTPHIQGTLKLKGRGKRLTAMKRFHAAIHWEATKRIVASAAYASKTETRNGKQWVYGISIPKTVKLHEPYGWQDTVMNIINNDPDERSIYWFWEPYGNVGKTTLCKYLVVKHNAQVLCGKSTDMFHRLTKVNEITLVVIDVPRVSSGYINYAAIEQIKNGLIYSGKYEGAQLVFDSPHVIVFANVEPDYSTLSMDRWQVYDIRTLM